MNWGRKRIRGLRRHFRGLRQRARRPGEIGLIGLQWLARYQQTYLNVKADPWVSYKEVPRKQEFRTLWVERFLCTLPYWHAQLQHIYPNFYLAIWLYEPTDENFWHSRLMIAVDERQPFYENHFGVAQHMPLPLEYQDVPGIEAIDWRAYAEESVYTLKEFEQGRAELVNRPQRPGKTADGEACVIVHWRWVWVGTRRADTPQEVEPLR